MLIGKAGEYGKGSGRPGKGRRLPDAKRSLGQNFLVSQGAIEKIVEAVGPADGEPVFEIGPGTGALTVPMARQGARVTAFELDSGLAGGLRKAFAGGEAVEIVEADVREIDFDAEAEARGWGVYRIAGNIPYLLTSTILVRIGFSRRCSRAVIMMQKEVGERINAEPGSRGCGILSVFMRAWFDSKRVASVGRGSFRPRPNVDSVVLRFDPVERPGAPGARREFLDFVKTGFSQRRKKLVNVLGGAAGGQGGPAGKAAARALAGAAGVDVERRAEELALEEWFRLFEVFRRGR